MDFKHYMLMAAAVLSNEDIISRIRTSLKRYDDAIGDEERESAFEKLQIDCALLMTRRIAPTMEDAIRVAQESDQHEKISKMINPDKYGQN